MKTQEIEKSVTSILKAIGENPSREGLKDTPKRVAKSYEFLFSGYDQKIKNVLKTFDAEGYNEIIISKDIDFFSTCEHHILPFFGKVHFAYIPDKKIVGISKIPRLIEIFARRLQIQERLTKEIAEEFQKIVKPKGIAISLEGVHTCMTSRGVQQTNSKMITTYFLGEFKNNDDLREEFLQQIK